MKELFQHGLFLKMDQGRPLFVFLRYFQMQNFQKKTEGFSRIRTWIFGVDGKHADHLTTTTANNMACLLDILR